MTTSRTGRSKWKNMRLRVLRQAQREHITQCPNCKVELNYEQGLTPSSAEVDHVIPYAIVQQDTIDNLRVICRRCNQSLGAKQNSKRKTSVESIDFTET